MSRLIRTTVLILLLSILLPLTGFGQSAVFVNKDKKKKEDFIALYGAVKTLITKSYLPEAIIIRYDDNGTPIDTIKTSQKRYKYSRNGGMEEEEISRFYLAYPRKDTTIVFDVECPGYMTKTITYKIENAAKSDNSIELPMIYMERAPIKLGEVTVTQSKVKFYNKGDTLVFNADAFQLAEGSMLDALISQLPGVELNSAGQIYVNGEFVETLLLDGKKFFDGDNNLMLQNIGAYTVKNIQVYKGQTREEKWIGDTLQEKHLTMDVRLKKEFNKGVIINAQGGYGTSDRYMGRLFASLFTSTTKLALVGNYNNLNDNRNPGKDDSWRPEMMPSGTREFRNGAFNYDYERPDEKVTANGYVKVEETINNDRANTVRTNFLTGGNTYDYGYSHSRSRQFKAETRNYYNYYGKRWGFWNMLVGRYIKRTSGSDNLSATFNKEQTDVTRKAIETLYTEVSSEKLSAVINRSITRSDGSNHESEVQYYPDLNYKIPGTNGRLRGQIGLRYRESKEERWRDYNINYGADPTPAVRKRQYFDNSPNRMFMFDGFLAYQTYFNRVNLRLAYSYRFQNQDKDSYMYALDRLDDLGVYGTLPAGYLDTFDPANSYTSRLIENKHSFNPYMSWNKEQSNGNDFFIIFSPEFSILHQHLDYWRDNRTYLVKGSSFLTTVGRTDLVFRYEIGKYKNSGRRRGYNHTVELRMGVETKTPDPTHKIDIINDSDPLNIALGNPDLKNETKFSPTASWSFRPEGKHINNAVNIQLNYGINNLVRGYTYDRTTGVRRNRTYNVDGNQSQSIYDSFSLQFGADEQFTISNFLSWNRSQYANMIGIDISEPEKSTVRNVSLSEKLSLNWQIGKQTLSLQGGYNNRHTTSDREDFNVIDANHYSAGFLGTFALPGGFGIATDFTYYARRGYGQKELDTSDLIWNLRLTYTPKGGRWVFTADGFDMLHQLSNVSYSVNDQARTVVFSNALPRYLLFTAQYRLNIQPKKK